MLGAIPALASSAVASSAVALATAMDAVAIVELLRSRESKDRLKGFTEAENYLDSEHVDGDSAPDLVDALVPALSDSNPKFVQGALGLLIALVEVMGEDLAPHTAGVWTPLIEQTSHRETECPTAYLGSWVFGLPPRGTFERRSPEPITGGPDLNFPSDGPWSFARRGKPCAPG